MKKIFVFTGLVGLIILNTTCSKERLFHKITWEGTLYDTLGGPPVSGVWIILHACVPTSKSQCNNYIVGQCMTDASGHFKIHDQAARSDRYAFQIRAGKYSSYYFGSFELSENDLQDKESKLYIKH